MNWQQYLNKSRSRFSTRVKDARNEFESDLGRVIFSPSIRRMHDKAQVIPLATDDCIHTRLTHSLEVMNIAYSLGMALCRHPKFKEDFGETYLDIDEDGNQLELRYDHVIPIILKTAALAHDIGNPPFGHFGETIIQQYFKEYFRNHGEILTDKEELDFIHFDGNTQGFRILTRLQYLGDIHGLNLTFATLGSYMKYPNCEGINNDIYIGKKKHGVFLSEKDVLDKIIDACHLECSKDNVKYTKRHPLAFLVEAADSICYNIMDIEDGLEKGWYNFNTVLEFIRSDIKKRMKKDNEEVDDIDVYELINAKPSEESWNDKKMMVDFRIKIIKYFVELAVENFLSNIDDIDTGTYSKELIEDDSRYVSKALQEFTKTHVFTQREIQKTELTGLSVLNGLLDYLISYTFSDNKQYRDHAKSIMSKSALRLAMHWNDKDKANREVFYTEDELREFDLNKFDAYTKLHLIVDFVSGMTDNYAVSLYRQLSGQQLGAQ